MYVRSFIVFLIKNIKIVACILSSFFSEATYCYKLPSITVYFLFRLNTSILRQAPGWAAKRVFRNI